MPLREGITLPIRETHLAIDLGQGQANPDFKASDLIGFAPPLRAPTEHRSCVGVVGCTPGGFLALAKLPAPRAEHPQRVNGQDTFLACSMKNDFVFGSSGPSQSTTGFNLARTFARCPSGGCVPIPQRRTCPLGRTVLSPLRQDASVPRGRNFHSPQAGATRSRSS